MSTQPDKKAIWNVAKKLLIREARYNLCTDHIATIEDIKDVFTSEKKIENARLRTLWLKTNKQSSLLWKNIMKELDSQQNHNEDPIKNKEGFWEDEQTKALRSLKENGYYIFEKRLPESSVEKINNGLKKKLVRPSNSKQQMVNLTLYGKDVLESKESKYIRWHFGEEAFESVEKLKELTKEPSLLRIAGQYLGNRPMTTNRQIWISKGINQQTLMESSGAAQLYHFDYDAFNFLKVMIYLSDVCSESGPHSYIKTSHKPFESEYIRNKIAIYGRYSDEQVYDLFGKYNELEILGKAGTVILVDTSGFHKGQILELNHTRLMAQIEFVDCSVQFGHNIQMTEN